MGNSEVNYSEIINDTASRHYNVRDEFKDNSVEFNREICKNDSLGYAVAALSLTGDLNVGIMIRTASLLGAEKFFIFGRRQYDKRSTVGAHKYIDVERPGEFSFDYLTKICDENDYIPVLVEQGGGDVREMEEAFSTSYIRDHKPLFIFGSESEGIPKYIPEQIVNHFPKSLIFTIPQCGVLRSYNVSTAMSIVTWEWSRLFMDRL